MAIFNNLVPPNDEAVKLGAQRIREMKTSLNSMLSQIFDDTLVFLPKFVTGSLIQNDASVDGNRAISSDHIKNGAVILRTLPTGLFTADATGRGKFTDGFVNSGLLDPDIELPPGSVNAQALDSNSVGTTAIIALAATIPKVGSGVAKIAIGTYAGSDSVSASITGLAFAPDFIVITGGGTKMDFGLAFKSEVSGGSGPIHVASQAGNSGIGAPAGQTNMTAPFTTAIQWTSDGFIVVPVNNGLLNNAGQTHSYLALKV